MVSFAVSMVPIDSIKPSPENDEVYGEVGWDDQMGALVASIQNRGLEEPLIVSADSFVISGHRRLYACNFLELEEIPVRVKEIRREDHLDEWPKILSEYNPQRVKSVASLLKESLMRFNEDEDASWLLKQREENHHFVDAELDFTKVSGTKQSKPISDRRRQFLDAANSVIERLESFWPLTVRQIHYQLLNDPPLTQVTKTSKYSDPDRNRYKNDKRSYDALKTLLTHARYSGEVGMAVIDDPTRPKFEPQVFDSVSEFVGKHTDWFLTGFQRNLQVDQPRHIEVLGEKGTLQQILKPVCREYLRPANS